MKRAPSPGALSSVTSPPIDRASRREMARPRPVPPSSRRRRARTARRSAAGRPASMPGPSSETVTEAVPVGARERQADRPALGRMADRIADQVDEDLDHRPLLPARAAAARRVSSSIATLALLGRAIRASPPLRRRARRGRSAAGPGVGSSLIERTTDSNAARRRRCRCRSSHNRCAAARRRARRCARRFR